MNPAVPALGSAWDDDAVQAFVAQWPQRAWIDADDLKKARAERRLSLIDEARGLYLFFTDADSHAARYGAPRGAGTLVLSRVSMALDFHPAWTPYGGVLPLGLRGDENAHTLLQRLGTPAQVWMAGAVVSKARWREEGRDVDVVFRDAGSRIALVTTTPTPLRILAVADASLPSPEQLAALFGTPLESLRNDARLQAFDLSAKASAIASHGEADCARTLGMELYFKPGAEMAGSVPNAPRTGALCLSGARYRADLDFESNGYAGPLPWGLRMSDTMDVVIAKAAMPAARNAVHEKDASQLWHTDLCDVHVLHSLLEARVYRVTLLARGCYD